MTPERLDELALEVALHNLGFEADSLQTLNAGDFQVFARALLAAVEAELKPVGVFANVNSLTPENGERWEHMVDESYDGIDYINLYSLPLIKEES